MQQILDRASGALHGVIVGDALGGRYEFMKNYIDQIDVDMDKGNYHLPILGGGIWQLYPGQITDDSELTLTLCQSILESKTIDGDNIAHNYHQWFKSGPFDIGNATKNAFMHHFRKDMITASIGYDQNVFEQHNDYNLSNGMMMRITPISIFIAGLLHQIKIENVNENVFNIIEKYVKADTNLTHASDKALAFAMCYVILMAYNILGWGLNSATGFINNFLGQTKACYIMKRGLNLDAKLAHDPNVNIGDVKIAFQLAVRKAFFAHNKEMGFDEAIISTIKLGGDTDTNACIVGGLVGSVTGINAIPKHWIDAVTNDQLMQCSRYQKYQINQSVKRLDEISKEIFYLGMINSIHISNYKLND